MERRFFTLSSVTRRINELLQPAINRQFWIRAEIASGRERSGSFFCDLVETDAKGKVCAKLSCNIWQSELTKIRALFKARDMDFVLTDGTVVGFLCTLQYSPQYGISLRVIDADPAFAMGEMELKRREIIERLQKEGLFEKNKSLFVPMLPLRIGLVTSAGSAAYNDFVQTLSASGYSFKIYLADALVQGDQTERSVLRALEKLSSLDLELIVIARGGGSKTDLSYLDNEAIARKIALCAVPVWTGIGHEIDTSVLDYVANKAFKTPTAVAEDLVGRFVQMRRQIDESTNALRTVWSFRFERDKGFVDRAVTGIRQGSRKLLDVTLGELRESAQHLRFRVNSRINAEQFSRQAREQRLRTRPRVFLRFSEERLASRRQLMVSSARSSLTRERGSLAGLVQRFERERFLRRLGSEREINARRGQGLKVRFAGALKIHEVKLAGFKARFSLERIGQRLLAEQRGLATKLSAINASSPERAMARGFTLTYRVDGRLVRSVHDVRQKESLITHLADGVIVSEVLSQEEKRE